MSDQRAGQTNRGVRVVRWNRAWLTVVRREVEEEQAGQEISAGEDDDGNNGDGDSDSDDRGDSGGGGGGGEGIVMLGW